MPGAESQKDEQKTGRRSRPPDLDLSPQIVMEDTDCRAEVDQAMEHLPAVAAETADPFSRGRDRERNHHQETDDARNDEGTLKEHVLEYCPEIEVLVEPDVCGEMDEALEKCEEAEHPAKADEAAESRQPPERSDGQRNQQKPQSPDTRPVPDIFQRVRA